MEGIRKGKDVKRNFQKREMISNDPYDRMDPLLKIDRSTPDHLDNLNHNPSLHHNFKIWWGKGEDPRLESFPSWYFSEKLNPIKMK